MFSNSPFNAFPFKSFPQVIDKLEYLGRNEEHSPYEVSPGTDLCMSDTYYSLAFLNYLHSYGRVVKNGDTWSLQPKGKKNTEKPHRFVTISDATLILDELVKTPHTVQNIHTNLPEISEEKITNYLQILALITQKGKVEQRSEGWDATYILIDW